MVVCCMFEITVQGWSCQQCNNWAPYDEIAQLRRRQWSTYSTLFVTTYPSDRSRALLWANKGSPCGIYQDSTTINRTVCQQCKLMYLVKEKEIGTGIFSPCIYRHDGKVWLRRRRKQKCGHGGKWLDRHGAVSFDASQGIDTFYPTQSTQITFSGGIASKTFSLGLDHGEAFLR